MGADRFGQGLFGDELDMAVQGQDQVVAGLLQGAPAFAFKSAAQGVLEHGDLVLASFELTVVIKFHALQAVAVDAGESQDLGGQGGIGIEAAVLGEKVDPLEGQFANRCGLFRRGLALDPYKGTILGELFQQVLARQVQRLGQACGGLALIGQLGRIGGQGGGFDAYRHGLVAGIVNRAALSGQRQLLLVLHGRLA